MHAFLRGTSQAILMVVKDEQGKQYAWIVNQFRAPVGSRVREIPAGVLENDLSLNENLAKEVREETGEKIDVSRFIHLKSKWPSVGGSDEDIEMYAYEFNKPFSQEKMREINGRVAGVEEEGEETISHLVPLDELADSKDGKTFMAYHAYLDYKRRGQGSGVSKDTH